MDDERIMLQLDKMVASGRITDGEAAQLRAAEGTPQFDAVVGAIRARHASAHMEAAVAEGDMSQAEAETFMAQLRNGEHPEGLRARLRTHRAGS
jgi:hypothetical protein